MRIEMDKIYCGDSLQVLQTLPENAVDCCVTSPPYYALRDYGADGQIGREATPEEYVSRITAVFHEVKRVLTPEGTCWLNIADTYCGTGSKADHQDPKYPKGRNGQQVAFNHRAPGCKPKDLIGIPWLVALALRGDGWYLRSSIIWHKTNPMPESTRDRPTRCYEYVFLLTKSKKYYYDWQSDRHVNDNNFDGLINNTPQTPTVADFEQRAKAGEAISVTDLAKAVKAEKREQPQKKPSILKKLDEYKKQAAQQPKDKQKEHKKDLEV